MDSLIAVFVLMLTSRSVQTWFGVSDPPDTTPPVALITAPGSSDGISVNDITDVFSLEGTASDPDSANAHFEDYVVVISEFGKTNAKGGIAAPRR